MDRTDCLGLPYPECAPPLVKDASDIEQFRDLAIATDTAVAALAASVTNLYTSPDAVSMTGGTVVAGQDVTHFLTAVDYDNASMGDTAADVIRIQETGWYIVGGYVEVQTAAAVFVRAEPLVNGDPVSSRQGPGFTVTTVNLEEAGFTDTLFLQAGDALQLMSHHVALAATVYTYAVRMWAVRILINV